MPDKGKSLEVRLRTVIDKKQSEDAIAKQLKQLEKKFKIKLNVDVNMNTSKVKQATGSIDRQIRNNTEKVEKAHIQALQMEKELNAKKMNNFHQQANAMNKQIDFNRNSNKQKAIDLERDHHRALQMNKDFNAKKMNAIQQEANAMNKARDDRLKNAQKLATTVERDNRKAINMERQKQEEIKNFRSSMETSQQNMLTRSGRFMTRKQKADLERINAEMKKLSTSTSNVKQRMKELRLQMQRLNANVANTASNASKLGDSLKEAFSKFPLWIATATIVMGTLNTFKEGIKYIVDMDTALTDLAKVTTFTNKEFIEIKDSAIELGRELGKSSVDIMNAFAEFGRVRKTKEDIVELGRSAVLLSNVTTLTAQAAAKAINVAMIAFKMDVADAGRIVDQFNEVKLCLLV